MTSGISASGGDRSHPSGSGRLDADVIVVGGGIAGCVAAVRAAEAGARVLVLDKTRSIRRSGDAGRGVAFLTTCLNLGEQWDSPDVFAQWYLDIAEGLVDLDVVWPLAIDPLPAVRDFLQDSGVSLRNGAGDYERLSRMWAPGPIVVKFDGADIKPRLAARVGATPGIRVVGGVHVTSVLQDDDGRAVGVAGFDVRSAEFLYGRAGAVIVATGSAERVIFNSPRRDPFNTYHRPYHATTGFAIAARAGAWAANLEFLGTFLFPRGFAAGAMGNLLEAGGRLLNGNGELIATLPATAAQEHQLGSGLVGKAAAEILAGRGPVYIDCTQLEPAVLEGLALSLPYDAPLFLEFLAQSGIDLARNPVEFELFSGAWSSTGSPKGVLVDAEAQTEVHGLFAAGDLATPVYALSGSLTSGYVAGAAAARLAQAAAEPVLDPLGVAAERDRVLAPLTRTSGISWREYERELQATMTAYVGMDRNDVGLQQAAEYLSGYRAAGESVSAANGHELMRAHEAFDLALFDEMMIAAARERDESRANFVMRHYRTDHPHPDDQTWAGVSVVVSHDGAAPTVKRTIPTPSWRTAKVAAAAAATRALAQTGAT